VDLDALLPLYVWTHNEAIRNILEDMHVGIYLCCGNISKNIPGHDHFNADGFYKKIAQVLFGQLRYNTLYLLAGREGCGGSSGRHACRESPVWIL
jgi:hypothetical protein